VPQYGSECSPGLLNQSPLRSTYDQEIPTPRPQALRPRVPGHTAKSPAAVGTPGGSRKILEILCNNLGSLSSSDKRTSLSEKRTDLLRGTLDLLILKALSLAPLHGVGVSRRITQITQGAFQVSFGSLFPSLHRMEERDGWKPNGGPRRTIAGPNTTG
jgi:hypothetical protein